jgi:hypothetical protein
MELYEIFIGLGIACFSVLLTGYVGIRYIKNSHFFEDIITNGIINVINDAQNDESLQKNLYTIGALLGNGIGAGAGLKNTVKGGGKLSLNNIIAEIASSYFTKSINNPSPSPLQLSPTPSPQDLTVRKARSNW